MLLLASKISKWDISAKHHSHQWRTFEKVLNLQIYLGNTVAVNAKLYNIISLRIGSASAVYGKLRTRL